MVYLLRWLTAVARTVEGAFGVLTLGLWLPEGLTQFADAAWRKRRDQKRRRRAAEGRWA